MPEGSDNITLKFFSNRSETEIRSLNTKLSKRNKRKKKFLPVDDLASQSPVLKDLENYFCEENNLSSRTYPKKNRKVFFSLFNPHFPYSLTLSIKLFNVKYRKVVYLLLRKSFHSKYKNQRFTCLS